MSAADGTVGGLTKLYDSGQPGTKWNLVIVSDGYQATEMAKFATDAQAVTDRLFQIAPFDSPEFKCAINVYRLDVTSTDSGADHPGCADGTPAGATAKTYFDSTFCSDGATQRLLAGDSVLVEQTVKAALPIWHQIWVLVNDAERGGAGGSIAWFSNGGSDWREVAVHELGHSAFELGDEYDDLPGPAPALEPGYPNVTSEPNPALVKWSAQVTAGSGSPTRANPNCAASDPGPSPVAANIVGTFEGGNRYHCGRYRPVWDCMMRHTSAAFCPVCTRVMVETMAGFAKPAAGGDVTLGTPTVNFNDVPTGLTVVRAARFDVNSCFAVSFQAMTSPAAPFALESSVVTVAQKSGPSPWRAYFWFRMTAGAVGPVASQQVTLRCLETGEDFVVTLSGNVVTRPSVATQLVFDKSGSMLGVTAEGRTKEQVLKDSATVFVDLLWDDNGIGVNAYDHDPHAIMDVEVAGAPGASGGRDHAVGAIAAHASNPAGMTAIGDGIELAKAKLDAASGNWDHKAMIVLTDGIETADKRVAQVADTVINEKVFAIGMGTAEQIQPITLEALTSSTDGYLLMTGNLSADETFLLEKYYVQILAGVNNNELVVDPEGWARPDAIERIGFDVTDSDVEITALILGRPANYLAMALETPDGSQVAMGHPSLTGRGTARTLYMRAGLPLLADGAPAHAGRWHLLLTVHPEFWRRMSISKAPNLPGPGIRYSANVAAYSNLRMAAAVHQDSYKPGAKLTVRAVLSEYGATFKGNATVQAVLIRPDHSEKILWLADVAGEPGAFQTSLTAVQSGIYRFRIMAAGRNVHDQPFTRETTRTAAVWRGGDNPPQDGDGRPGRQAERLDWCELAKCLLEHGVINDEILRRLAELGIDIGRLRECIARHCGKRAATKLDTADHDELRRRLKALLAELEGGK
jgi:hypothetical protein